MGMRGKTRKNQRFQKKRTRQRAVEKSQQREAKLNVESDDDEESTGFQQEHEDDDGFIEELSVRGEGKIIHQGKQRVMREKRGKRKQISEDEEDASDTEQHRDHRKQNVDSDDGDVSGNNGTVGGDSSSDSEEPPNKGMDSIPDDIFEKHMSKMEDKYFYEGFELEGISGGGEVLVGQTISNKKWKRHKPRTHEIAEGLLSLEEVEMDDDELAAYFCRPSNSTANHGEVEETLEEEKKDTQKVTRKKQPVAPQQQQQQLQEQPESKLKKKKQKQKQQKQKQETKKLQKDDEEQKETVPLETAVEEQSETEASNIENIQTISMKGWKRFTSIVTPHLMHNLKSMKFFQPTPIQVGTLEALKQHPGKDIVLAAQTGSGKTLSFGLPIVSAILKLYSEKPELAEAGKDNRKMKALILSPTRELAVQITKHLKDILTDTKITIACIVGGISEEKQMRLLSYRPDILVATPGRYWDIMQSGQQHLSEMEELRYLVVDEADRMVADGYFPELRNIVRTIFSYRKHCSQPPPLQKIVASATMTLDRKHRENVKKKNEDKKLVDELADILNLKRAIVIDYTPQTNIASTVEESMIQCSNDAKDSYLYYLLLMHPGKTIVFGNSISSIRHIRDLMEILGIQVYQLHGEMQQGQRLKSLDNFKKNSKGILAATDVAARGLDIHDIDTVIHFQMPRSVETYVHRCGRSGRMHNAGFSIAIVSPEDKISYGKVCEGTKKPDGLMLFPVDDAIMPTIQQRINLARKIKTRKKKYREQKAEASWFVQHAKEADIELDDHFFPNVAENAQLDAKQDHELAAMQKRMQELLQMRIAPKRLRKSFLTSDEIEELRQRNKRDAPRNEFEKVTRQQQQQPPRKKQKKMF